jgi:hypothetical protein
MPPFVWLDLPRDSEYYPGASISWSWMPTEPDACHFQTKMAAEAKDGGQ